MKKFLWNIREFVRWCTTSGCITVWHCFWTCWPVWCILVSLFRMEWTSDSQSSGLFCSLQLLSSAGTDLYTKLLIIVYIIQSVGIPGWGNSGWITAISVLNSNIPVSVFMMVVAGFFTGCAVLSVILLKMVHSMYRHTGASFQKAQEEFSQGVVTNRTFQSAAATAASSAVQGAFH